MSTQDFARDDVKETLRRVYRVIMTWPCPSDEDVAPNPDNAEACDNGPQSNIGTSLTGAFSNQEPHSLTERRLNFGSTHDFSQLP